MRPETAEQHRAAFTAFARAELASGGPDPQVELTAVVGQLLSLSTPQQELLAGCFVGPYTCGSAGPLFQACVSGYAGADLTGFISQNWDGLPRRRERRAVDKRSGEKLALNLETWREWTWRYLPGLRRAPYPELYGSVRDVVKFNGRYATMKVLEVLKCAGLTEHGQDSICAAGAKYPRRTLALIYPASAPVLNSGSDGPEALAVADRLAAELKEETGIETWFDFETLLCNYRQALAGKYPGRSHDRELAHFRRAEAYWGRDQLLGWFPFYEARERLFPAPYLGELGDPPWWAARPELEVPFEVPA